MSIKRLSSNITGASSFNYRVREAIKGTLQSKFGEKYTASEKEKNKYKENSMRYRHQGNTDPDALNPLGGNPGDFWDITTKGHSFAHFAVYPEALCEIQIKAGCPENGIVLDPFFGSGTTGLVALKQNKKFIGIELNPEYIKIANQRLKPLLEQTKII